MVDPKYQELLAKDIPKVTTRMPALLSSCHAKRACLCCLVLQAKHEGVTATVIAGEAFGIKSPVYTLNPTMYLDFEMEPNTRLEQNVPTGQARNNQPHPRGHVSYMVVTCPIDDVCACRMEWFHLCAVWRRNIWP